MMHADEDVRGDEAREQGAAPEKAPDEDDFANLQRVKVYRLNENGHVRVHGGTYFHELQTNYPGDALVSHLKFRREEISSARPSLDARISLHFPPFYFRVGFHS